MGVVEIASLLFSVAPTIAKWLGGDDAEDKAKSVCDAAKKLTGIDTAVDAVKAIKSDPAKLKQLQEELAKKHLDFDLEILKDKQNARDMQIEMQKYGKSRVAREFVYWYAGFLTLFACSYIACITFLPVPETATRFADTAQGFIMGTLLSALIQFFYGASKPIRDDE